MGAWVRPNRDRLMVTRGARADGEGRLALALKVAPFRALAAAGLSGARVWAAIPAGTGTLAIGLFKPNHESRPTPMGAACAPLDKVGIQL